MIPIPDDLFKATSHERVCMKVYTPTCVRQARRGGVQAVSGVHITLFNFKSAINTQSCENNSN